MSEHSRLKILFIGKKDDHCSQQAADFIRLHFRDSVIIFSKRGDAIAPEALHWKGDLLISYLAQWIIPQELLERAQLAAINFHPGPPEYPGIGCTNFAIYNGEKTFGITCHHMVSKVDSGEIIIVRRFPVFENDTVYSITQRCYIHILHAFYELMGIILMNKELPSSSETWKRPPYRRKDLNKLCELTPDMSPEEIDKRVRATTFGDQIWAFMKVGDQTFSLSGEGKIEGML